jgi:hypothetical protein
MKRRLVFGALVGLAAYATYRYRLQAAAFAPNAVPIGNLVNPEDPYLYAAIAAGALGAYAFTRS